MRFFLDNDVPVSVRRMLGGRGHNPWTAYEANLADEGEDDALTVYAAEHKAVLITLDKEFSDRRRKAAIGHHVQLRCSEPEAAALLAEHLEAVIELLAGRDHVTIRVSKEGVDAHSRWQ